MRASISLDATVSIYSATLGSISWTLYTEECIPSAMNRNPTYVLLVYNSVKLNAKIIKFALLAPPILIVAVFVGDVADDLSLGASLLHVAVEGVIAGGLLAVFLLLRRYFLRLMSVDRRLSQDLDLASRACERLQRELAAAGRGLAPVIDAQSAKWGLSEAEAEICHLLLKGLSMKEVAQVCGVSERTVRQQAHAIYRKAGVAGRHELSAFFLEDLLAPTPPSVATAMGYPTSRLS